MDAPSNLSRHEGKPLLRLLECYVLWVLDELSAKEAKILEEMTPKLQQVYNVSGTWMEIVESVMELPSTLPAMIRDLWVKNAAIAKDNNVTLTPQRFAEMFVDQNLAD